MRHEDQVALAKRLLACEETGQTASAGGMRSQPTSVYTDPELQEREIDAFFLSQPLVACLSPDLPEPGSFLTQTLMNTPVLISRGLDGQVRAFLNACSHRGTRVEAEPCGKRKLFTCPFHGWSFATEGHVVAIPKAECFGQTPAETPGLSELPCTEKYGIVWIRLRPGPPIDPDAQLGPLRDEIASWDVGKTVTVDTDRLDARINWKMAVDTFGETYHFAVLHQTTISNYFHSNLQAYDVFGRNHRMCFVSKNISELRSLPEAEWNVRPYTLMAYYLFPNTQLLITGGGAQLFRIFPQAGAVGQSQTHFSFYALPEALAANGMETTLGFSKLAKTIVQLEDYATAETAQANLASGLQRQVIFGDNEPALHHYHATYEAALSEW